MSVIPLRRSRPLPDVPAFGACAPSGRRRRVAVVLVLVLLLGTALAIRASGVLDPTADRKLPPLPAAAFVAPGLVRGGRPGDIDFLRLRDAYGVRAIVDVDGMDAEEEAVTSSLGLRTLQFDVPDDRAPAAADLLGLLRLLRSTMATRAGDDGTGVVYMHDADGRGPVLMVTAMLQVLRGMPPATALDALRAGSAEPITGAQTQALYELDRARAGLSPAGAYAVLRGETW
jgi:hypothetical protein